MLQATLFRPPLPDRPVLHLRSWASVNGQTRRGEPLSGHAYTIMALPRAAFGEVGQGRVDALTPQGAEVDLMRALVSTRRTGAGPDPDLLARYRAALEARWASLDLSPGSVVVQPLMGVGHVQSGDVLCCACAASEALSGRCHRAWAAPFLVRAGWRVFLDGVEVVEDR